VLAFNTSSWTSIEIKNWVWNGTVNRNAFILNKQTKNLPYTFTAPYDPKIWTWTIDNLISQQKIKNLYWQNSNFKNCTEIETAKKLLLTWTTLEYQIIDDNWILTNINCP
jgi:hypothetical protein